MAPSAVAQSKRTPSRLGMGTLPGPESDDRPKRRRTAAAQSLAVLHLSTLSSSSSSESSSSGSESASSSSSGGSTEVDSDSERMGEGPSGRRGDTAWSVSAWCWVAEWCCSDRGWLGDILAHRGVYD